MLRLGRDEKIVRLSLDLEQLKTNGFVVMRRLAPDRSTIEIARGVGTVVNVERLLPTSSIPTVQSLKPREAALVHHNQYSGHYGLGSFPLHTDLAHWCTPPHYLLLRCITGTNDVLTELASWVVVANVLGTNALQKAVFAGRQHRIGCSGYVRAMSRLHHEEVFRWDPIFLRPINKYAQQLADFMRELQFHMRVYKALLRDEGDTILIDNWRTLHGRSHVEARSIGRHIERVYFSELLA